MPHRTPHGSLDGNSWDDYDLQHVRNAFIYDDPQATSPGELENVSSFDPAGGLSRNEIAELTHIWLWHCFVDHIGDSFGTEPGRGKGLYELKFDDTSNLIGDQDLLQSNVDIGTTNLNLTEMKTVDPRHLLHLEASVQPSFNDTVNGTGGGASSHIHENQLHNLRREFGQGPIVDRRDELHEHFQFNIDHMANQEAAFEVAFFLYWDVAEED